MVKAIPFTGGESGCSHENWTKLRAVCLAVIDTLEEHGLTAVPDRFRAVVEEAYRERNRRGLRAARAGFVERIRSLPIALQDRVAERMKASGVAGGGASFLDETISRVLQRGRIADEDEFRMVLARVEEIAGDESRSAEVERLNQLLLDVEDGTSF